MDGWTKKRIKMFKNIPSLVEVVSGGRVEALRIYIMGKCMAN